MTNPDLQAAGDEALEQIDRFGLGDVRSISAFETFCGVEFEAGTIDGKPAPAPPTPESPGERQKRQRIFTEIWEQSVWGNSESVSGSGAAMAQTEVIRRRLLEVFKEFGIEVLADAGCGDMNWMSRISQGLRLYLGFDIVPGLLDELRSTHAGRKSHFFSHADIVVDTLPACDAILCRDCLTHLSLVEVRMALKRMKKSGSTYLIATTHDGNGNAQIVTGGWHPMALTSAPFEFPAPLCSIDEGLVGTSKALGVWRLADLGV